MSAEDAAFSPTELADLRGVFEYWNACLAEPFSASNSDAGVAARMVGVVANAHHENWSSASVCYSLIFEQAAALELPETFTRSRSERWAVVEALMTVFAEESQASSQV